MPTVVPGLRNFSLFTPQCAGIWSSHSAPESFKGTFGSRPRLTAPVIWEMRFS